MSFYSFFARAPAQAGDESTAGAHNNQYRIEGVLSVAWKSLSKDVNVLGGFQAPP